MQKTFKNVSLTAGRTIFSSSVKLLLRNYELNYDDEII